MISASGLNSMGLPEVQVKATNRTGSTLTVGGVYAIDRTRVATESTSPETSAGNVVACATANIKTDLAVALGATLDDAEGLFQLVGNDVSLLVDGTTDVAAGDPLIPQNASANLIKQGAGSLVTACALALEAQTTDAGTLTRCAFDGRALWKAKTPAS